MASTAEKKLWSGVAWLVRLNYCRYRWICLFLQAKRSDKVPTCGLGCSPKLEIILWKQNLRYLYESWIRASWSSYGDENDTVLKCGWGCKTKKQEIILRDDAQKKIFFYRFPLLPKPNPWPEEEASAIEKKCHQFYHHTSYEEVLNMLVSFSGKS